MLSYKKLDAYKCAIEFLSIASQILDDLPKGNAALADQLRRASLSIPLNIAEGTGKYSPADKRRFYMIARGSTMECGAILDACVVLRIVDEERARQGEALLTRISEMLTRLSGLR